MSSIITITVYTLDELSCPARRKARDWYRQHHADSNWYENVYEDFREVCGIFGIDLRQRVFRLSNGRFMEEPCIWFSGCCSQGDGACFEGRWHWQPATVRRIRKYAPQEHELHRIADALQAVQKRNFCTACRLKSTAGDATAIRTAWISPSPGTVRLVRL